MSKMSKKSKSSEIYSPSAELIGGIDYFICKILHRLPVRSLIRSKCVSKQWLSLISDPQFGLEHTLKNPSCRIPSGLFFYNPLTGARKIDSVSLSKFGGKIPSCSDPVVLPADVSIETRNVLGVSISMKIVQSCNGLILLEFNSFEHGRKLYCVCNLATKQQKFVPLPNLTDDNQCHATCFLAFDPSLCSHYKVVYMHRLNGFGILIFSSETGQWKQTDVTTEGWKLDNAKGVYCNGSIYWISTGPYHKFGCHRFDVESENLTMISVPRKPGEADNSYFRYFGECNGHLHLVFVRNVNAKKFNVLELDEVTQKWFIKYRVHINCLISPLPEIVVEGGNDKSKYAFSVLNVVRGEKEEDSALIISIPGKVVSYNFRSKKVVVLHEFPKEDINMNFRYASTYPFVATLYPLSA